MDLYIIRHGIAAPSAASDRERPLTTEGREQLRQLSGWLLRRGDVPSLIISSPLVRAVQTAKVLAEGVDLATDAVVENDVMAPGADPERLCAILSESQSESVAIVGHSPDVGVYASYFTGGEWLRFGCASIACLEFDELPTAESGLLKWFVGPRELGL